MSTNVLEEARRNLLDIHARIGQWTEEEILSGPGLAH